MHGAPSAGAWLALAGLWALWGFGFLYHPAILSGTAMSVSIPRWGFQAAIVVALVPATVSVLVDAPWQALIWWGLLQVPAAAVLWVTYGFVVIAVVRRRTWWKVGPWTRLTTLNTVALLVALLLWLPVGAAVLLLADSDLHVTVALSLLAGYLGFYAARAIAIRFPATEPAA